MVPFLPFVAKMTRTDCRHQYSHNILLTTDTKNYSIPANEDGTHKLGENALPIWPRGNFMLIALPNLDGSYTCTLICAL